MFLHDLALYFMHFLLSVIMSFIYVFLFYTCLNTFCECFKKHGNLLSFCDKKGELI
jgi:hypothetical protein